MKAFITTIGEPTTDLCKWALERLEFDVQIIEGKSSLWEKLKIIFDYDEDFLRVDADTIVNKNVLKLINETYLWWYQTLTFDWFKQDLAYGGVQFIRSPAIPIIRQHIDDARSRERPESYLYRLEAFHNPRVCGNFDLVCGLNGYGQTDIKRIKDTKLRRDQYLNYDWELAEKITAL